MVYPDLLHPGLALLPVHPAQQLLLPADLGHLGRRGGEGGGGGEERVEEEGCKKCGRNTWSSCPTALHSATILSFPSSLVQPSAMGDHFF